MREWLCVLALVGGGDVTVPNELILVDHQSINTDRTARMSSIRTDSHFGAKSIAESVGKVGGRIPVNTGRVDLVQETLGAGRVFEDGSTVPVRASIFFAVRSISFWFSIISFTSSV